MLQLNNRGIKMIRNWAIAGLMLASVWLTQPAEAQ